MLVVLMALPTIQQPQRQMYLTAVLLFVLLRLLADQLQH
jgi:hypothetical protein